MRYRKMEAICGQGLPEDIFSIVWGRLASRTAGRQAGEAAFPVGLKHTADMSVWLRLDEETDHDVPR
jgi:hypothetical protein